MLIEAVPLTSHEDCLIMVRVTFLGTGGGRFATVYQVRHTGGIYIEAGANIHLDPGPGAVINLNRLGFDPASTDGILISHCHPDHYADAEVLIEGMTRCNFSHRGLVAGSRSVIDGTTDHGPAISRYHKSIVSACLSLSPGDRFKVGTLEVQTTPTSHSDTDGIGFRFLTDNGVISYVSDSELTDEVADAQKGARMLIMSITRPLGARVRYHMCTEDAATLVNEIRPEIAVMTHFGSKLVHEGAGKQARFVQEKTGIRTVAAEDFMRLAMMKTIRRSEARPSIRTS
jgi:phosphoribosyl 1,2-cyclic phosphodiesterase